MRYMIVFDSQKSGNPDLYVTFSKDGISWTEPVQITTDPAADMWPSLIQTKHGDFMLAFISDRSGEIKMYTIRSKDGLHWSEPSLVDLPYDTEHYMVPSLIQTFDGRFMLAYTDYGWDPELGWNRDVYVTFSKDGETWSDPIRVTTRPYNEYSPCLMKTHFGYKIMFSGDPSPSQLYVVSSRDGITWGEPIQVTDTDMHCWGPLSLILGKGNVYISAFRACPAGEEWDWDLYLIYSTDGETWSEPELLLD